MAASFSRRAALAAVLLAAVVLPARGEVASETVVGLIPSPREDVTRSLADGLRLAFDEARQGSGPDLVLRVAPSSAAWSTVASTAVDLSRVPGVVALVTPPERRLAHPIAQVGTRAQIPIVATSSAASVLATGSTWVVGVAPRSPAGGESSAGETPPPSFDASAPAARAFVAAYRARHDTDPDPWAALGYEAGRRLVHAVGRAGRRGAALAAALAGPDASAGSVLLAVPTEVEDAGSEPSQSAGGGSRR